MYGMTYRGYTATFEFDADDRIFVGRVLDVDDIIGFHANSVDELEHKFQATIDGYLKACSSAGAAPDVPKIKG